MPLYTSISKDQRKTTVSEWTTPDSLWFIRNAAARLQSCLKQKPSTFCSRDVIRKVIYWSWPRDVRAKMGSLDWEACLHLSFLCSSKKCKSTAGLCPARRSRMEKEAWLLCWSFSSEKISRSFTIHLKSFTLHSSSHHPASSVFTARIVFPNAGRLLTCCIYLNIEHNGNWWTVLEISNSWAKTSSLEFDPLHSIDDYFLFYK